MSHKPFLHVSRWNMGQNKTNRRVNQTFRHMFFVILWCILLYLRCKCTIDCVFRILVCKVEGTSTTQSLQSNIATPFIKSNRHCITIIAHLFLVSLQSCANSIVQYLSTHMFLRLDTQGVHCYMGQQR